MVGRGGKRSLPSVASARARNVHKEARRVAASCTPTEADRQAKDEMRAAAARGAAAGSASVGQPPSYAPGAPVGTSAGPEVELVPAGMHHTTGAPSAQVALAPLVHGSPPVHFNGNQVPPPMVQFSAPPPPPLFDPSTFLSGSLAGATRLPPLSFLPGAQQVRGVINCSPPSTGAQNFATAGAGAPKGLIPTAHGTNPGSALHSSVWGTATGDVSPLLSAPQAANNNFQGPPAWSAEAEMVPPTVNASNFGAAVARPSSSMPSAPVHRPVTPPALKRAGARRAAGIRRPLISSVPAGSSTCDTAAASGTATAAPAAGQAAMPTGGSAATPSTPCTPDAGVGRASGGVQTDTAARSSAFAARRASHHKPGGKRLARKRSDSSSDDVESVPAGPKPKKVKQPEEGGGGALNDTNMQKLMDFLKHAPVLIDAVDNLTGNMRLMSREMQSQGKKMEDLTVSVKGFQQSPTNCKRRMVDTDGEEYYDHEEMNTLSGNGTVGSAALSTTSAAATAVGKKLSFLQEGTIKMLRVRGRVKSRTFGNIGGATYTRDVLLDLDADWKLIVDETKEELSLNDGHANSFLLSDISPPTPRNSARKVSNKGKTKVETRRAYQPITQAISHVLEAIKKRTVAAWFFEIKSTPESMLPSEATEWLGNRRVEGGGEQAVKPRFEASELGLQGMLAAVKAMFKHLGVQDRIREPTNVGDAAHVVLAWGHLALCAAFVRAALEQIEAGGTRRRTGMDSGWYDRWRWEVLALKAFVPQSKTQWHGMVISDAEDPALFVFPMDPVPVSGARTLVELAKSLAGDESEDDAEAAVDAGTVASVTQGAASVGAAAAADAAASGGAEMPAGEVPAQRATAAAIDIAVSATARAEMAAAAAAAAPAVV
ncbi:hypothetical protein BU14_0361s0014 [Porphyra umbilicalis]|uniref:Uncharacterized protein n=1 Tax=Porphyra umbilicalis TaxID=2786 RepID=A0A1X6NXH8_PORUM|nr:hypothetical protein BU14_0361s0014 [Porphyra umbilicalis]|eukprot:OSX73287.1 hypothetical protein BU14_0361s0014 [Porphyra umbilicalis]